MNTIIKLPYCLPNPAKIVTQAVTGKQDLKDISNVLCYGQLNEEEKTMDSFPLLIQLFHQFFFSEIQRGKKRKRGREDCFLAVFVGYNRH